jgi:hypothetical protein
MGEIGIVMDDKHQLKLPNYSPEDINWVLQNKILKLLEEENNKLIIEKRRNISMRYIHSTLYSSNYPIIIDDPIIREVKQTKAEINKNKRVNLEKLTNRKNSRWC